VAMVGSLNGFSRFNIEVGVERMGRGSAWSTRLPWARRSRPVASGRRLQPVVGCGIVQRWKKPRWLGGLLGPDRGGGAAWAGRQAKAREVGVTRQPKRKGGEMG
jgi:hypothetical protein